jgi:hypothetical protein
VGENIDPTWLAWASTQTLAGDRVTEGLERIAAHYQRLVDYPLATRSQTAATLGLAMIGDAEPRCHWPHFAGNGDLAIATAYVPTGWERLTGSVPLTAAPLALARSILAEPDAASRELNAPVALAVLEQPMGRLVIANDAIGAARVYELEAGPIRAWSNRPGALCLFAGIPPRADARGWRVLAAAGWFLADASPIEGVRRVGPGTVIEADAAGIRERTTGAVGRLVQTTRADGELAEGAAAQARAQAETAGLLWEGLADVDLSGGRDSRLAAAAVVAAGTRARFLTSDATPGEADVAAELVAAAPVEMDHRIRKTKAGSATPGTPLLERAAHLHLLHDGVRHPQKLRGKMTLPRPRPSSAAFSGHGGEIAHGFFYKNPKQLRRLRGKKQLLRLRRREDPLVKRVMRFFTKDHEAAIPDAYAEAERVIRATMDAGREHGLEGPVLLDWFYLVDRFAHRSGVATDSERVSVFATPAFIRAAFALSPEERLDASLHREVIGKLVPQWRDIGFFQAQPRRMPSIRRQRLWEVPDDAQVVEEILAGGGSWTEIYDPERAASAWRELRDGGGSAKWEGIFEGIVYRHTFDEHLQRLGRAVAGARRPA